MIKGLWLGACQSPCVAFSSLAVTSSRLGSLDVAMWGEF